MDRLHGAQYFTTVDIKQVEIEENHKERTAFTLGPLGFWEFNKLPFGCSNSPATFERIVEEILGGYNMTICIIFLDDLIIFSSTFEEHLERLNLAMSRLHQAGLKLSPEKCQFMQRKVRFLGHVVGPEGVETDPEKCSNVRDFPRPTNPDQMRSFVHLAGYYRKFIPNYSKLAKPLTDLLPLTVLSHGNGKRYIKTLSTR